jgi:hypothetical protein
VVGREQHSRDDPEHVSEKRDSGRGDPPQPGEDRDRTRRDRVDEEHCPPRVERFDDLVARDEHV